MVPAFQRNLLYAEVESCSSSKMLLPIHQSTRRHVLKYYNLSSDTVLQLACGMIKPLSYLAVSEQNVKFLVLLIFLTVSHSFSAGVETHVYRAK